MAFVAGLVLLALVGGEGSEDTGGPTVKSDGCPILNAARAERIFAIEMRAVGPPWSTLIVSVSCDGEDLSVVITDSATRRSLEQGLFSDAQGGTGTNVGQGGGFDKEEWFARVVVESIVEQWRVPDPRPPVENLGVAAAPAPAKVEPGHAPTFTDWLGPNHIGIRASWRWLNLGHSLPVAEFGVHFGRPISPHLTPFAEVDIATGDGHPTGANVDTVAFQAGGGLTLNTPLDRHWTCEADLGAFLIRNRITLRETGTATLLDQESGFAGAAGVAVLFAYHIRGSRLGLGVSSGYAFGAPSRPIPSQPTAAPVSIDGLSLGVFLHVGSAPVPATPATRSD